MGISTATVPLLETNADITPLIIKIKTLRLLSVFAYFNKILLDCHASPVLKKAAPNTHMAMIRITFSLTIDAKISLTPITPKKYNTIGTIKATNPIGKRSLIKIIIATTKINKVIIAGDIYTSL
ncbi:hypothetical protein NUBL21976_21300 [Klebsiella pneumoniae]|nr:hypothetical protein NUBL21976_21300 [Klebsiella pneumoniae]